MYRIGRKPTVEPQDQPTTADELIAARGLLYDAVRGIDQLLAVQSRRDPDKRRDAVDALLEVRLILRPAPVAGCVPVVPGGER